MKKIQAWTSEEDSLLVQLYKQAGCFQRWKFISKKMKEFGISKTQFQCRDRFTNHVDPSIKHGKLSNLQIAKFFGLYDQYGPRWSLFETKISGRPQSLLKNKFYSTLRSLVRHFIKVGQKRNLNMWSAQTVNLSSKMLIQLYEGRKKFLSCKNILRNCLKFIGYYIEGENLQGYLNNLESSIMERLFQTIYLNHQNSPGLPVIQKAIGNQQIFDLKTKNNQKIIISQKKACKSQPIQNNQIVQNEFNKQVDLAENVYKPQAYGTYELLTVSTPWSMVYQVSPYSLYFYPV